ncbi:ABC transporter permease [Streptomyces sp. NPDC019990]|uniref:ABC transporter permease n=1 Tax=Streptomyces sp. NPDC019990 TaxID=3154693 RepID=UPI0033EFC3F6
MSDLTGLRRQLSAELLKARSGFALPAMLVINQALISASQMGGLGDKLSAARAPGTGGLASVSHTTVGLGFAGALFAMLFGAIMVTNEYRSGAIGRSVLHAPSRTVLLGAKLASAAIGGVIFGIVSAGGALLVAWLAFRSHDVSLVMDDRTWAVCGSIVLVCLFAGPWGAAVGFLLRSQLLAIVVLMVWTTTAETMILKNFPAVGKYLPGGAQNAVMEDPSFTDRLSVGYGVLLLLAWGVAAALAAQQSFTRRDLV